MGLTHLDAEGRAAMVDVSPKPITVRKAVARGRIRMSQATADAVSTGGVPKGDVLAAARLAGIQAAKATASLIPLCHSLPLDAVRVDIERVSDDAFEIGATVTCTGRTGVEMEALTAVSVALLTVYDMAKAIDRAMVIEHIELVAKSGGRSGDWRRDEAVPAGIAGSGESDLPRRDPAVDRGRADSDTTGLGLVADLDGDDDGDVDRAP